MMTVTMSEDKKPVADPSFALADNQVFQVAAMQPTKSRFGKRNILIAVVCLLTTGLLVTAVLVGIRLFTDSNMEIAKYSLQANGVSQNVSVDNNVVSYHVVKNGVEAWIVQDFDKELQVTKVLIDGHMSCYVTALNRTMASDASSVPDIAPHVDASAPTGSMLYQVVQQQIADISFLGKKASTMCQNIPTYHAIPDCGKSAGDPSGLMVHNATSADHRSKRTPRFCATCNLPNCECACGCCGVVCGIFASNTCIYYYSGGTWWCTYYMNKFYGAISLRPSCAYNGTTYWP